MRCVLGISRDRYVRTEEGTPMRQDTGTLVRGAFVTVVGGLSVPLAGSTEARAQVDIPSNIPVYNPYPSGILPAARQPELLRVRRPVTTICRRSFAGSPAL